MTAVLPESFELVDESGATVRLNTVLKESAGTVVLAYRGHW